MFEFYDENNYSYIYKMTDKFLNKETHRFYISLTDDKGEYLNSYFRIVNNGKGYSADYAPNITSWGINGKKFYFTSSDVSGTKKKTITRISVNKKPTKQTYTQNIGSLSLSGGSIRVKYSDGSSKIVSMTNKNVKNSGFSNSKVGTVKIKLEYSNKTTNFNIKIIEKKNSINITTTNQKITPTKTLKGKKVVLPEGDKVYFLDVQDPENNDDIGGSDAIILESNGLFGMIDTSKKEMGKRIVRYLNELNVKELDFVIITHNHSDHDGGLRQIVNSGIKIKNFYIKDKKNTKAGSSIKKRYQTYVGLANKAGAKICKVDENNNNQLNFGNMKLKLYNTKNRYTSAAMNGNVNSLGIVATVNGKRIYFTGDIQNDSSRGIYASDETAKEIGKIDVYKAAHHGNYNGFKNNSVTTMSYLKPTYTIITGNKRNYKVKRAAGVIGKYTKSENMYYTPDGTVILNIAPDGNISFKKLKADG